MKNINLFFLLVILASVTITAQNSHIKNTVLGLKFHTYKTSDIGIKNAKNVVEMEEKYLNTNFKTDEFELTNTRKYKMQKGKITNYHYVSKFFESEYDFIYSKNYKILQKQVYVKEAGNEEEVNFKFDDKNRIIEFKTYLKKNDITYIDFYNYNDENNSIEKYELNKNAEKINIIKYKTDNNSNIISKNEVSKPSQLFDKIREYTYANGSNVTTVSAKEVIAGKIVKDSETTSNYVYDKNGLLIEDSGDFLDTDLKFNHNYVYKYEYDKNGNWIKKYKFSTNYGYDNLSAKNYKKIINITLRKFTYKKGVVTGGTDVNASKVQNYLSNILANNPFETKKAPKEGVYWKRTSERAIKLYDDRKYIGGQSNLLIIIDNDFYANDSLNNVLYKLADFKLKPENKAFYEATVFAKNNETVWFRSNEKSIKAYINGASIVKKLNYHKIYGDDFYINDSVSNTFYLLKDFKLNKIRKTFYKAIPIAKQDDVVWVKLENGNFSIVRNGNNITNNIKMIYAKKDSDVLIKLDGVPKYVMVNAANVSFNKFRVAVNYKDYLIDNPNDNKKVVIPNGYLWKKNNRGQFYLYNNGETDLSEIKVIGFYSSQFIYDVTHNTSCLLKDYSTKNTDEFYPITKLEGNMFFYITKEQKLGIIKNGIIVDFSSSKYAKNGIDVIAIDANGVDTYILKDYKNQGILTLGKVIDGKNYTE